MENPKRAHVGKPQKQPRGSTYVEPGCVSQGLERVREAARGDASLVFTNLLHHITEELLDEAYYALNPKARPGVDQVTWGEYGEGLKCRLKDLHERVHRGSYRALPEFENLDTQGRGAHEADRYCVAGRQDRSAGGGVGVAGDLRGRFSRDWLRISARTQSAQCVGRGMGSDHAQEGELGLDADVRGFFDSITHEWIEKFVSHRVGDQRILRLIHKWLKAGVSEDGQWSSTVVGTPQGATISPLLGNVYLHYVLDLWVEAWRKRHARGEVYIVRYADDFAMGFQYRDDAEAFQHAFEQRMQKFGLELNTEKTRLIEFGRFAMEDREKRGEGKPETFDFLGFTHFCARRRKDGRFVVRRTTIAKRLQMKVKKVAKELKRRRHDAVADQGRWLRSVVRGYFNYHAVPGNIEALGRFRKLVTRAWLRSLRKRSHKARGLTWVRMRKFEATWLPRARILHPYPNQRLCVNYPR